MNHVNGHPRLFLHAICARHSLFQTSQNNQTGDKTFCILKGLKKGKCHQEKRDKNSLSHVSRHFFLTAKLSVLMLNRFDLSC